MITTQLTAHDQLLQAIARRFPVARALDSDDATPLDDEAIIGTWRSMLAAMDRLGFVERVERGLDVEAAIDMWCPSSVVD